MGMLSSSISALEYQITRELYAATHPALEGRCVFEQHVTSMRAPSMCVLTGGITEESGIVWDMFQPQYASDKRMKEFESLFLWLGS